MSGAAQDKENIAPQEEPNSDTNDDGDSEALQLLAIAEAKLELQTQRLESAKAEVKNSCRREKCARANKDGLKTRLDEAHTHLLDLDAANTLVERSEADIRALKERISGLTKKNKALTMQVRRAPGMQAKALEKVEGASRTFKLQGKGVFTEPTRELVMDLVSSYNVPVAHVDKIIKSVAQTVGVTVEGTISEPTVGRVALEGGVIAQVQIIDELRHAKDLTICGDGTTLRHVNYESKHVNFGPMCSNQESMIGPAEMEKIFLGVLANATEPAVQRAVRGVIDFTYYAHFETHCDESLAKLDAAWAAFHAD
ncbi:hypothetical protein C8J57DRAFT_1520933 [Mycena rebaudengoi]|nr:hypothetical protein C8J57DRAFT_1520933 [Mycena rebaudengoi]